MPQHSGQYLAKLNYDTTLASCTVVSLLLVKTHRNFQVCMAIFPNATVTAHYIKACFKQLLRSARHDVNSIFLLTFTYDVDLVIYKAALGKLASRHILISFH